MRIDFTVFDDDGNKYEGSAELVPVSKLSAAAVIGNAVSPDESARSAGLPDYILGLRGAGFFREPRTPNEVHAELQETYHCLLDRVQMALLRLQRRRELRKTVKRVGDQERLAYVW
jgi:hypothetical protein